MARHLRTVALGLLLAAACVPPAYRAYEGKAYRLRVPLSGPRYLHANGFGAAPVIPAGTEVRVTRVDVEQKVVGTDNRWCTRCDLPSPCPPMYQPRNGELKRCPRYGPATWHVAFTGPDACGPAGCEAVWRLPAGGAVEARFEAVFGPLDASPVKGAVAPGMTPDEVRARLGLPDERVDEARDTVWRYRSVRCRDGVLEARSAQEVRFRKGTVVGNRVVRGSVWAADPAADHALYCGAAGRRSPDP